jgi:myo-inositol-1(or 4)-monophosphatase
MVALADKLSNLRDIAEDYRLCGEECWKNFHMKNKDIIGEYYKGIRDSLYDNMKEEKYFIEYAHLVSKVFE